MWLRRAVSRSKFHSRLSRLTVCTVAIRSPRPRGSSDSLEVEIASFLFGFFFFLNEFCPQTPNRGLSLSRARRSRVGVLRIRRPAALHQNAPSYAPLIGPRISSILPTVAALYHYHQRFRVINKSRTRPLSHVGSYPAKLIKYLAIHRTN